MAGTAPKQPARSRAKAAAAAHAAGPPRRRWRRAGRWLLRGLAAVAALYLVLILLFAVLPPPVNLYQLSERWRLGPLQRDWVAMEDIAPAMARSVVAAEDANFCLHWGFDVAAIRQAMAEGSGRGASTITQQTVKNVFLWHGRSWLRKGMEAVLTPVVELAWTKRRVLEVYLNVAEFGEGVFGVEAAARHHFGISARELSPMQAARLAAVLPDPKNRDPARPGPQARKRARQIADGAATIAADGRAACFED